MLATRRLGLALGVPILLLAVLQLVPYGRNHSNPPDGTLASFDSPGTEQLAKRACYDCHSNRTNWPWYSAIAPVSWRIQRHVDEGREKLNFTAFNAANADMADAAGEAGETVTKGEMPPADYQLAHPESRLTAAEKQTLVAGLDRTFAAFAEGGGKGGAGGESRDGKEKEGRGGDED
jgi:hypothetical protein